MSTGSTFWPTWQGISRIDGLFSVRFFFCIAWHDMAWLMGPKIARKKTLTASARRLASLARMSESRFHFFHESWVLYFLNIVVRLVCGRKRSTTPCWFSLYTVHSRISWQRERRILATATPRRDHRGEAGTTYRILHLKYLEIYLSHLVQRFHDLSQLVTWIVIRQRDTGGIYGAERNQRDM